MLSKAVKTLVKFQSSENKKKVPRLTAWALTGLIPTGAVISYHLRLLYAIKIKKSNKIKSYRRKNMKKRVKNNVNSSNIG